MLVTANPGTGKTLLLAYKYLSLIEGCLGPEDILCLTFTYKAKNEMEDRILKLTQAKKINLDLSKINIFTFHSYALDCQEGSEIISTNLLRYTIYDYLKRNEVLNYGEKYLIDTIVAKMENLIRYLKSFGITYDNIDLTGARKYLVSDTKFDKADLDRFAEEFINIFRAYEEAKNEGQLDYNDILINFLQIKNPPVFKYVLIDELQDVNDMEADIALKSGVNFMAVGDQKQAIFGFQGGSILNFKKFGNSKIKYLSENFRSTNEILNYASEYFISKTKDKEHQNTLEGFMNNEIVPGEKPKVYSVPSEKINDAVCSLATGMFDQNKEVAVIARTNYQIMELSKELCSRGINHSSTYFSASGEARDSIICFLKSIFSNDMDMIKAAMFTPFFPITLRDAFALADNRDLSIDLIYKKSPEFKSLRESAKCIEDVNILFIKKIIPVSIGYGEEYFLAAQDLQQICWQALTLLDDRSLPEVLAYLKSAELMAKDSDAKTGLVLTTVHKAKGREFENVIYYPRKTKDKSNFQNRVVEGIMSSKGKNVEEELEEEALRINFVAFTRARENLMIVTDKPGDFLNDYSIVSDLEVDAAKKTRLSENNKRAYTLFINKEYDKARELLEVKDSWIIKYVQVHFDSLERISYSKLTTDANEYFTNSILGLWEKSLSLTLGSDVHHAAEAMIRGERYEVDEKTKPYIKNVKSLINEIQADYPENHSTEKSVKCHVSNLTDTEDSLLFKGKIDAVFKNEKKYLIVDWKTDWSDQYASKHRQQLELYKRLFSISEGINVENISVAIGYVGLKHKIHDGTISARLDMANPASSAFNTVMKRVNLLLSWRQDVHCFFENLKESKDDDSLKRSILEQYEKERQDL